MDIKSRVEKIAAAIQQQRPSEHATDIASLWATLEKIADEGATVVLKLDGGRTPETDESGRYTVILSGGALGNEFFHEDSPDLNLALCRAIVFYAERIWKGNVTSAT